MRKRKTSDAEGGICFSGAYNEQTDCGAGGKALKARVCESEKKRNSKRKTSDAEGGRNIGAQIA